MKNKRPFLDRLFNDPSFPPFMLVNDVLAVATIITVVALILESVPQAVHYQSVFTVIEYTAVALFSLEYVLRVIGTSHPLRYVFSFFGIIDLLAIVPTYIGVANLTALKSARMLRLLRLLRIMRLAKLTRSMHLKHVDDAETLYRMNLKIYGVAVLTFIVLVGSLMYVIEGAGNISFSTIPHGMLWALQTIIDPGSAAMPESTIGTIVRIIARLSSLILFAFCIHILGNIMNHLLLGTKLVKKDTALSGEKA